MLGSCSLTRLRLELPFPNQIDVADALAKLLNKDTVVRSRALRDLHEAANYQNTVYDVTRSVAAYIAAALSDSRTETVADYRRIRPAGPLRAELLDWLSDMSTTRAMLRLRNDSGVIERGQIRSLLQRERFQRIGET